MEGVIALFMATTVCVGLLDNLFAVKEYFIHTVCSSRSAFAILNDRKVDYWSINAELLLASAVWSDQFDRKVRVKRFQPSVKPCRFLVFGPPSASVYQNRGEENPLSNFLNSPVRFCSFRPFCRLCSQSLRNMSYKHLKKTHLPPSNLLCRAL